MSSVRAAPAGSVGLLIGYGSVGMHHARVLAARYGRLAVVDNGTEARERAHEAHPDAVVASSLESLAASDWDFAATRATIATWGPSHRPLVDALLREGVRHLLVEKPMASSVASAHGMADGAKQTDARLGVHLQRRVSGIMPGLHALAARHDLGDLVSVTVDGGARCLVTNGMHWLDLGCGLFDALPTSVASTARGQAINPRSPDLQFYEGTAVWDFPGDRTLAITFTNRSSIDERLRLWYRTGVIDLTPGGFARIAVRPADQVERFPAITRTGPPSEVLEETSVPDVLDAPASTSVMWSEIDGTGPLTIPAETAIGVLGGCIGAVTAGSTGTRIDLPIDPGSDHGQKEWPIS